MRNLLNRFWEAIQLTRCMACYTLHARSSLLCTVCLQHLPWLPRACNRCAHPLPNLQKCVFCAKTHFPLTATFALFTYQFPIVTMIHALKYQHKRYWALFFADLIVKNFTFAQKPQALIPVPSDPKTLRKRGFNPAMEIAKVLSTYYKIPLLWRGIVRQGNKPKQAQSTRQMRYKNVDNAFRILCAIPATIAIVDDVLTTGATLAALANTLYQCGAKDVQAILVARTIFE